MQSTSSMPVAGGSAQTTDETAQQGTASRGPSATKSAAAAAAALERQQVRIALRKRNLQRWSQGPVTPAGNLDSSMKKNTGFIRKIRQGLGVEAKAQLIKEAASLNLDKYVEELTQAIPEGLAKCTLAKDCIAACEIVTDLHARFADEVFAVPLAKALSNALKPSDAISLQGLSAEQREREEGLRVIRQRPLLRISAELALVELLKLPTIKPGDSSTRGSDGQEWLFSHLKDLLSTDREHQNVSILTTLLKALGPQILSVPAASEDSTEAFDILLVEPPTADRFRKLCDTYFSTLAKRVVKEHDRLREQERKDHEAYIKSGHVFDDRQQRQEKMTQSFERSRDGASLLSDLLGLPMPTLSVSNASAGLSLGVNLDARSSLRDERPDEYYASGKSPWEDEETRRFYEDVLDLKDMIPAALLSTLRGGPAPTLVQEATTSDAEVNRPRSPQEEPSAPTEGDLANDASVSPQINALLGKLPECTSRSTIDSAAVDCALLNIRTHRKRLVKQLIALPRSRLDLVPYYARLVATLSPYIPELSKLLLDQLDDEFRYLQRKRTVKELAEARTRNARFFGELTKFGITPMHTIYHCFSVCLDDFAGPNIDILAALLETCGRFLLRTETTAERMRSLLEMLRRKRLARNLDQRQVLLLDNAYYQCNPPERQGLVAKVRSPMELYIRHLIYERLNRKSVSTVVKLLRKLHWSDAETLTTLGECFTRVWRVKFSSVHLLAAVLADLHAYHADFAIAIIDAVCEEIRRGMETNLFKHNQRRLAMIEYLSELYNYRLINSNIIFDQLWSLITFLHPNGRALPGQICSLDLPDDYFRIRLACRLLDNCGPVFKKGSLRKRLEEYLAFFNLYLLSKEQPPPLDIEFMLQDTFEGIAPDFSRKKNWEEAAQVADEIMARHRSSMQQGQNVDKQGNVEAVVEAESESDDEDDSSAEEVDSQDEEGAEASAKRQRQRLRPRNGEADDFEVEVDVAEGSGSSGSEDDGDSSSGDDSDDSSSEDSDASSSSSSEEDEAKKPTMTAEELEAEEDFARELAKMMSDNSHSTRGGSTSSSTAATNHHNPYQPQRSGNLFDQGLSFIRKQTASASAASESSSVIPTPPLGQADDPSQPSGMTFSLLSRKGNKVQTNCLSLPSDSRIAVTTREKQLKDLEERRQLKEYVLGYEERASASASASASAGGSGASETQTSSAGIGSDDTGAGYSAGDGGVGDLWSNRREPSGQSAAARRLHAERVREKKEKGKGERWGMPANQMTL